MQHELSRKKKIALGITLLIVGGISMGALWRMGNNVGRETFSRAWQEALGAPSAKGSVAEVRIGRTGTTSSQLVQEGSGTWSPGADEGVGEEAIFTSPPASGDEDASLGLPRDEDSAALERASTEYEIEESDPPAAPSWCNLSDAGLRVRDVTLNEIAWMGSAGNPNDEWIELRNSAGQDVDVSGWQLQNKSGSIQMTFGEGIVISIRGLMVAARNGASPDATVALRYAGALSNSGDELTLFDGDCKIADRITATGKWPGGNNETKQTLERDADLEGWHTSVDPGGTPGKENSVPRASSPSPTPSLTPTPSPTPSLTPSPIPSASPSPSPLQCPPLNTTTSSPSTTPPVAVVISKVRIAGADGATAEDYIELYNPGDTSTDISGWRLLRRTKAGTEASIKSFPGGSVVIPKGRLLWANSEQGFAAIMGADVSSKQNIGPDSSIALVDADGVIIDAVAWGSGHADPYIEGTAYPRNPGPEQDLLRKFKDELPIDTGNNAEDFKLLGD